MDFDLSEWLNLTVRWFHIFAGILWVGQTYYFTWLDGRFAEAEKAATGNTAGQARKNTGGQVWMVHSGGFYVVEKQKGLERLPEKLHWFRWEAALTWISGMILLVLVYYMGGVLVDSSVADIGVGTGVGIGLGVLVGAWGVYDLLCRSPLGRSERALAASSYVLIVLAAYGLTHVLSGRAAYIHMGAMLGTLMTLNVWMRILPAQRRMIAAVQEGRKPDERLAARAKLRSKHNTYMAVPVVFLMISNHFPAATYGSRHNWVILSALVLAGWGAAKLIRRA